MICKEKWKPWALVAVASCLAVLIQAGAAVAAPKYPDLRTLPPSDIHLGASLVGGQNHYVVRFSNEVANAGTGAFELHGTPHFPFDGLFDASQWVYDDSAGFSMESVGTFAFHPNHQHFHFDGFARYELWSERAYQRAASAGFTTGSPLATSPKVSFCILDIDHVDAAAGPPVPVYRTCTPVMEGLSAGWGDIYDYLLPDQWVDVGERPLADGKYVIRSIADPDNLIFESDAKADPAREGPVANSAVTPFTIVNGRLAPA
jgi:hypothetical protein